jgi:hypothetical protein
MHCCFMPLSFILAPYHSNTYFCICISKTFVHILFINFQFQALARPYLSSCPLSSDMLMTSLLSSLRSTVIWFNWHSNATAFLHCPQHFSTSSFRASPSFVMASFCFDMHTASHINSSLFEYIVNIQIYNSSASTCLQLEPQCFRRACKPLM